MDGRQQTQQLPKKPIILNLLKHKPKSGSQQVPSPSDQPQQTINVDQLAREKVEEIEDAIDKLTSLKHDVLDAWFSILKQIITAADLHRSNDSNNKNDQEKPSKHETGDCIYADYIDDNEQLGASIDLTEQFATNSVKWTIRVHAFKLVHRLVNLLSKNNGTNKPFTPVLVKLLPDLVRLSFVAATSPYDELKMQGFEMFKHLIIKFASVEEKEFPGHLILEQYKTQVLSAVKPAFDLDAPPYTTAIASQICSLWVCHGLEKESNDVKRTFQLMMLSVEKLNGQGVNQHSKLYTESELEQERVDILGSWAQLYIAATENKLNNGHLGRLFKLSDEESVNLSALIEPQVESLVDKWWEALKDFALLIMPSPKIIGTMHDNEHVYTREVALKLFEPVWPKLVLAQTHRLVLNSKQLDAISAKFVQFLCGIILKELSRFNLSTKEVKSSSQASPSTILALRSLYLLLSSEKTQSIFRGNLSLAREFYSVLYQTAVTHVYDQPIRLWTGVLLDILFNLSFKKISHRESCVQYSIAKLISLLLTTMKEIDLTSKQELQTDMDALRVHLTLRLRTLVLIIKKSSGSTLDEALQEALIAVFQEMLRFDQDKSVSSSLIEQLQHIYPALTDCHRAHMIDELYPDLKSCITKLGQSLVVSMKEISDFKRSRLIEFDAFFEAFKEMIRNTEKENKSKLLNSHIQLCNKVLDDLGYDKNQLIESKIKRELVDYFINHVTSLHQEFMEHFKNDKLLKETLDDYQLFSELQKIVKDEIESKSQELKGAKKASISRPGSVKPRAKITLKADFSNFYKTQTS